MHFVIHGIKGKSDDFHYKLTHEKIDSWAAISQVKTVSTKRMLRKLGTISENDFQIIRPKNFSYDIAIQKLENGSFTALLLSCTHAANQLTFTGNSFFCKLHGSAFSKQGLVTKGPAEQSLKKLGTQISDDNLIVSID